MNWNATFEEFYQTSGVDRETARKQWNAAWAYRLDNPSEFMH